MLIRQPADSMTYKLFQRLLFIRNHSLDIFFLRLIDGSSFAKLSFCFTTLFSKDMAFACLFTLYFT